MKMQLSDIMDLIRPARLALIDGKKATANSAKVVVRHELTEVRRYNETFKCNKIVENSEFIHIGKCGGTTIQRSMLSSQTVLRQVHMKKAPLDLQKNYIIWLRNPINRFVSAFNHSKRIIDFPVEKFQREELTIENSPAPQRIVRRIKNGYAFSPEYDRLVKEFDTANDLAESLFGDDLIRRKKAQKLMRRPEEHIFRGIGWHLDNGHWIEKFAKNVLFVGSIENMDSDLEALKSKMGDDFCGVQFERSRTGNANQDTSLSTAALSNVRRFYADTDYKALGTLHQYGLITDDLYALYTDKTSD